MITYTWSVTGLEVINEGDLQNVAIISYFSCDGEDEGGIKGQARSDVRLLPPDPADFTDIDNVTEQQAADWTLAALGESGVERYEEMVKQQIEGQYLPKPRSVELPWMPPTD